MQNMLKNLLQPVAHPAWPTTRALSRAAHDTRHAECLLIRTFPLHGTATHPLTHDSIRKKAATPLLAMPPLYTSYGGLAHFLLPLGRGYPIHRARRRVPSSIVLPTNRRN